MEDDIELIQLLEDPENARFVESLDTLLEIDGRMISARKHLERFCNASPEDVFDEVRRRFQQLEDWQEHLQNSLLVCYSFLAKYSERERVFALLRDASILPELLISSKQVLTRRNNAKSYRKLLASPKRFKHDRENETLPPFCTTNFCDFVLGPLTMHATEPLRAIHSLREDLFNKKISVLAFLQTASDFSLRRQLGHYGRRNATDSRITTKDIERAHTQILGSSPIQLLAESEVDINGIKWMRKDHIFWADGNLPLHWQTFHRFAATTYDNAQYRESLRLATAAPPEDGNLNNDRTGVEIEIPLDGVDYEHSPCAISTAPRLSKRSSLRLQESQRPQVYAETSGGVVRHRRPIQRRRDDQDSGQTQQDKRARVNEARPLGLVIPRSRLCRTMWHEAVRLGEIHGLELTPENSFLLSENPEALQGASFDLLQCFRQLTPGSYDAIDPGPLLWVKGIFDAIQSASYEYERLMVMERIFRASWRLANACHQRKSSGIYINSRSLKSNGFVVSPKHIETLCFGAGRSGCLSTSIIVAAMCSIVQNEEVSNNEALIVHDWPWWRATSHSSLPSTIRNIEHNTTPDLYMVEAVGKHWYLTCVLAKQRLYAVLESLGGASAEYLAHVEALLRHTNFVAIYGDAEWTHCPIRSEKQENLMDCGLFCIENFWKILLMKKEDKRVLLQAPVLLLGVKITMSTRASIAELVVNAAEQAQLDLLDDSSEPGAQGSGQQKDPFVVH